MYILCGCFYVTKAESLPEIPPMITEDENETIPVYPQGSYEPEDFDSSKDLMYINIKNKGYIIRKDTTIEQIKSWYEGEHEFVTDSLFGGKAYSFYVGNNYDDYLYIETTEEGKIFSYGSVDTSFKAKCSYGDKSSYSNSTTLFGCLSTDNGKVVGGVFYNKSVYLNGSYNKIVSAYTERFEEEYCKANHLSDKSKIGTDEDMGVQPDVILDMSKHSALMFNGIMHSYGKDNNFVETDKDNSGKDTFKTIEEFFYINNQFLEFDKYIGNYADEMGFGTNYLLAMGSATGVKLYENIYGMYIFNPLLFGGMAVNEKNRSIGQVNIPVWTYRYNKPQKPLMRYIVFSRFI